MPHHLLLHYGSVFLRGPKWRCLMQSATAYVPTPPANARSKHFVKPHQDYRAAPVARANKSSFTTDFRVDASPWSPVAESDSHGRAVEFCGKWHRCIRVIARGKYKVRVVRLKVRLYSCLSRTDRQGSATPFIESKLQRIQVLAHRYDETRQAVMWVRANPDHIVTLIIFQRGLQYFWMA